MNVDAIIFDKDGTLIDFDAFWVTISVNALNDVLRQLNRTDVPVSEILEAFGVRNGVTDVNGILCKGTYAQMGEIVYHILTGYECTASCDEIVSLVNDAYKRNADTGIIKPTCQGLVDTLLALKKRNIKLAVVTTDNEEITRKCLRTLEIEELFDKIYTDDGKTPSKPDPYCAIAFADFAGVKKERLVMVGDTTTDMKFAKNAGILSIGLAGTDSNRAVLEPYADVLIAKISELLNLID